MTNLNPRHRACGLFSLTAVLLTTGFATPSPLAAAAWINPAGGSYDNAGNWSPVGVPGAGDSIFFGTQGTYDIRLLNDESADDLIVTSNVNLSFIPEGAPGAGDKTLTVGGNATINNGGLTLEAGAPAGTNAHLTIVGNLDTTRSVLNVFDGARLTSGLSVLDGRFNGGAGFATVSGANLNGSASRWDSTSLIVGKDENAFLDIEDGGVVQSQSLVIAETAPSSSGGAFDSSVSVLGTNAIGTASELNVSGPLSVGLNGRGELRVEDGAIVTSQNASIAFASEVLVKGTDPQGNASRFDAGNITIDGRLKIEAGAAVTGVAPIIQNGGGVDITSTDASGTPSTWNTSGVISVGSNGHGDINITAGGRLVSDSAHIATDAGNTSISLVRLTGGGPGKVSTWTNTGDVYLGGNPAAAGGTAELVLDDHQTRVDISGRLKVWGTGSVEMNHGVLTADMIDHTDGGVFGFHGGALQVNQFDGDLDNPAGVLAPGGDAAGSTVITGNYQQGPNAVLPIDIGGDLPAATHDQINIGGNADLDGLLQLTLINGYTPDITDVFTILDAGSITAQFDNVISGQRLDTASGEGSFIVNYGQGSVFDPSNIVLNGFIAAPGIEGDLNDDGFVGIIDMNLVLKNWNLDVPPGDPAADPSEDRFVGIDDLNIVLANWNNGVPPSAVNATVPEPGPLGLIALGLANVLSRRKSSYKVD